MAESIYSFRSPQFVEFVNGDNDEVDQKYFEFDHENNDCIKKMEQLKVLEEPVPVETTKLRKQKSLTDLKPVNKIPLKKCASNDKLFKNVKTTVACSPKLLTKNRHRQGTYLGAIEKEINELKEIKSYKFKAQPIATSRGPVKAVHPEGTVKVCHKVTKVQPFSFEMRDKYQQAKKEQKIQEALQKEKQGRQFHANPLPKSVFKPPPIKTITEKKPISVKPFNLSAEHRVEAREKFRLEQLEKLQRQEELKRTAEKRRFEEEKARLRKMTEFKSNPIRHYNGTLPKKQTIPLTEPKTPRFESKKNKENKPKV